MNTVNNKAFYRQFRDDKRVWQRTSESAFQLRGANIQDAASHNRKIILHAIRARGAIGRLDLARITGLTPPAVFKIAKDLLTQNLVVGTRIRDGAKGQPGSVLAINADAAFSLGLNIDRDHLTVIALDFAGAVRKRFHVAVPYATPEMVRAFFAECIAMLQQDGTVPMSRIAGIGIARPDNPGVMPADAASPSPDWLPVPVSDLLADLVAAPLIEENDAAAAATGEMLFGAGLQADSFFYLFISVGLGGGIVFNRQYVPGAHGRSGELGVLPQVNPFRSRRTDLGRTLEHYVSIPGLLDVLCAAGVSTSSLEGLIPQDPAVDEAVDEWVENAADLLYLPLLTVLSTLDPAAIFLGGHLPAFITDRLCNEVSRRLSMNIGTNWPRMAVRPGLLSHDAAAVGAAILAFRDL